MDKILLGEKMKYLKKYYSIFLPLILGSIIGLIISTDSYSIINKPLLSPPSIVFPIVWTILYLIMGYSYYKSSRNNDIKKYYYLQLIVNLLWSIIFFSFKLYFIAIIWIMILIYLVIKMIKLFYNDNKTLGLINIPYLAWLFFALYLTIGVYLLNK